MRALVLALTLAIPASAAAQSPIAIICDLPVPYPARSPEPGQDPIVMAVLLCFGAPGGVSLVEPQTYLHYVEFRASEPSRARWVPYDENAEQILLQDFRRLWATNFLDDLRIETVDLAFPNGTPGKVVVFHLEERARIKIVDYDGATRISRTDINDRLKERGVELRLDSFVDHNVLRRVATLIRELYAEKGYQYAEVRQTISTLPTGPKLAQVRFVVSEGPRVAIRDVEFIGNTAFADDELARQMKVNRARGLVSLVTGRGMFDEHKFEDDAQALLAHYRNRGYIEARIGTPALRVLDDSADGRTRWVQLRIDVDEGRRYRVGNFTIAGATVAKPDALRKLFDVADGAEYREELVRKGLEKVREIYGAGGYYEFTGYPDLAPRAGVEPPTVDVTLRLTEGKQYFVSRIEFTGNTLTRDSVIRRELGLTEGGVFNTEQLKYSLRRINQLGFFKPLDEQALQVERSAGADNKVDITLKVEEQNRNQLTFGAGASQYEGLFVNVSYTTANFLGKGESVTASVQTGARARSYQFSFSEPFILGRNLTAGGSAYSRKIDYALASATTDYSEVRSGFNLTGGMPWRRFTRLFLSYGYEFVDTAMTQTLRQSFDATATPFLVGNGSFEEHSVTPTIEHNTVDNPFAPRRGKRLTFSYHYAGGLLGGTNNFAKPDAQAILYVPLTSRTAIGMRVHAGKIWNFGSTELPYYQRYFLGGDNSIRGVDVRTIGPLNDKNVAIGGTSFALFNAEYYVDLFPQVRALAFHDAGQAFTDQQRFNLRQLRTSSGVELRVTMPVVNVPFRLIYFWNIYRDSFQPARGFKFGVGTTF